MRTTHPEGPHFHADVRQWRRELLAFCKSTQLLGLVVEEVEPGGQEAFVTFVAELRQDGVTAPMRERSRFVRTGERWLYYGVAP